MTGDPGLRPPPPPPPPPARPAGASRYGWLVGVLAIVILSYILLNTLRTKGPGAEGPQPHTHLAPFAAPLVLSAMNGDANVAAKANSGRAGKVPACSLKGPSILTSCELSDHAPVVLGFFFTRGAHCEGSFDAMQRLSATNPGVRFAGVVVRGDRDQARAIIRRHGWRFPIAYDHDGGLANVYGIAGCPEVVLAYPGGEVRETIVGRDRAERQLGAYVGRLVAASRARGWRPGR